MLERMVLSLIDPLRPAWQSARSYSFGKLRADLVAGITVAAVELPQSMAYAYIAGVPAQYGLYTSVIQGFFGAILASNNHLATGPTNTQALLTAAIVTRAVEQMGAVDAGPGFYLSLVVALTLIKGVVQLAAAAAHMGTLVRYVSQSVIVGFTAGAGVLIAVGQVPALLGFDVSDMPREYPGVVGDVLRWWPHLHEIDPRALLVAGLALVLTLGARLFWRLLPGPLLAVVGSGVLVVTLGWIGGDGVALVGEMPQSFPSPQLPAISWRWVEIMLTGAIALALLGMIETVAIGKAIGARTGERINANREFLAQGVANCVGSLFQNIPGSGSFTRSGLNHTAGGRTRFAGMFNALAVAALFLLLADWAQYIPLASLAAILIVVAYSLIDWRYMLRIARAHRPDAVVCLITFASALLAPLQYAIYVGVFLNIALYLRQASQLHMNEMVNAEGAGPFMERPLRDRQGNQQVVFLQLEGDLFFGLADELQDRLTDVMRSGARVVILRLKRTHSIDATVLSVLERFAVDMRRRDNHVVLCGLKPELLRTFDAFGLTAAIGRKNVFETGVGVFSSAKRAIQRARELLGESIDTEGFDTEESEAWAYEI